MGKFQDINAIYKILGLYEDISDADSPIDLDSYMTYLDKLYIQWLGSGVSKIYNSIKGLYILGGEATHKQVKSTVFGIIETLNKLEEGVEMTMPLASSRESKMLLNKENSKLLNIFRDIDRGDILIVKEIHPNKIVVENIF